MADKILNEEGFDVPAQAGASNPTGTAPAVAPSPAPDKSPASAGPAATKKDATKETNLPADFGKCLALLRETQGWPENTPAAERKKKAALEGLAKHMHALQQGVETSSAESRAESGVAEAQAEHAVNMRLESLGRQFPEVRALLDERDALLKKHAKTGKK